MQTVDKNEKELIRVKLLSRFKKLACWLFGTVAAIWLAYVTQVVIANITSTTSIEYRINTYKLADYLPQNIAEVAPLKIADVSLSDAEVVTISLWNRTSSNLDRINIRIATEDGSPKPFHKVILFPSSLDRDWVSWAEEKESRNLEFSVMLLNKNWSKEPNVTVRFFYPSSAPKNLLLKTNKPGVEFSSFNEERFYWWMFGLEGPLMGLGVAFALILLVLVLWRLNVKFTERQYIGFTRVFHRSLLSNFPSLDTQTRNRFLWLGSYLYIYSLDRVLWREKTDQLVKIPDEIGEPKSAADRPDSSPNAAATVSDSS